MELNPILLLIVGFSIVITLWRAIFVLSSRYFRGLIVACLIMPGSSYEETGARPFNYLGLVLMGLGIVLGGGLLAGTIRFWYTCRGGACAWRAWQFWWRP